MSLSSNADATKRQNTRAQARARLENFPIDSIFVSDEQMQRFELLRLAFFVLKLRKLNEQMTRTTEEGPAEQDEQAFAFQRNLLHHTIFQQILTLTRLGAREQAMQIISACHTK
ncbi:MAG TPA: hypothetical protein VHD63_10035 [Ktedonobacteraceae bacterium]|nr:hypothetical protein [Ktedonobacteraceae bacterium]